MLVLITVLIAVFTVSCDDGYPETYTYKLEISGNCSYYCVDNKIIVSESYFQKGLIYLYDEQTKLQINIIKLSDDSSHLDCVLYVNDIIVESITILNQFEEHNIIYYH